MEEPLCTDAPERPSNIQKGKLKRKNKSINGVPTVVTTYTIEGEKYRYMSEEVLNNTKLWTESAVKGSNDIMKYSDQLKTLVREQSSDYLSLQVLELINRYYAFGKKTPRPESPAKDGHSEEQTQLQVAIDQLIQHIERAIKKTKKEVYLLRKQTLLIKNIINIEQESEDSSSDISVEIISSLSTDLRMVQNQYKFGVKKFSEATHAFYGVQVEREKRFKDLVFTELVREKGIDSGSRSTSSILNDKETLDGDEIGEIRKLTNQIINYASHKIPEDRPTEHEHVARDTSEETQRRFPSYQSAAKLVSYASNKYYEEMASHKLEVMTELSNEIFKVEKSLRDLNELFTDISTLILDQSELVDDIFLNMQNANQYVEKTAKIMHDSKILSQKSRRRMIVLSLLFVLLAGGFLLILKFVLQRRKD